MKVSKDLVILARLYEVDEGTFPEICRKIKISQNDGYPIKRNLLLWGILIPTNKYDKSKYVGAPAQIFTVNKQAIDKIVFDSTEFGHNLYYRILTGEVIMSPSLVKKLEK